MDLYSVTLGLAILAAVAAFGLALAGWLASRGVNMFALRAGGLRRSTRAVGVIALALVSISGLSHRITGHSSSALGPAAFLAEHPALLIAAGVAIAALVMIRITARVSREAESGGRGA